MVWILRSLIVQADQKLNKMEKMARLLFSHLAIDREAKAMEESPDNSFSKDWFKHRISENEVLVLGDIQTGKGRSFLSRSAGPKSSWFYFNFVLLYLRNHFELAFAFFLIILFSMEEGMICLVYSLVIILLLFLENRVWNVQAWRVVYLMFVVNVFLQLLIQIFFKVEKTDATNAENFENEILNEFEVWNLSDRMAGVLLFVYGGLHFYYDLIVLALFETVFLFIGTNMNCKYPDSQHRENKAQAIYRLSINESWRDLFTEQSKADLNELRFLERQRLRADKKDQPKTQARVVESLRMKVSIYKYFESKFRRFLSLVKRAAVVYNRDRRKISKSNFNSFWWRNFSYRLRKSGVNLEKHSLLCLAAILLFFLIFFHQLERDSSRTFMTIVNNSKVQGTLGVNFTLILLCICLERFMYSRIDDDWIGGSRFRTEQIKKQLRDVDLTELGSRSSNEDPVVKFRRAKSKVVNAFRFIEQLEPRNPMEESNTNPLVAKFAFSIMVYLYLSFLIFIWLPLDSLSKRNPGKSNWDALFCNNRYKIHVADNPDTSGKSGGHQFPECNNFVSNRYLQIMFVLTNLYLLIAGWQIRKGFSALNKLVYEELEDFWQISKFYLYKYTPFLREIKTVIDYTACATALNIFQWIKLEDVQTTIKAARISEKFNSHSGRRMNKYLKRLLGFTFLTLFFLLLTLPLYLFSDIIPSNTVDEVHQAYLSASAGVENTRLQIFTNQQFHMTRLHSLSSEFKTLKRSEHLKMYELDLYKQLQFQRFSEHYFEATSEMLQHLNINYGSDSRVSIDVELEFQTAFKGKLKKNFNFDLSDENGHAFVKMLTSADCREHAGEKLVLGEASKLILLKKLSRERQTEVQDFLDEMNFLFILQYNCDFESGRPYFELSNEHGDDLSFLVLQENITNSVELLAKLSRSRNISILSVYAIIFSYIGLTVIRNAFFGMSHRIWTMEIPNAHRLEEHVFLIEYSRIVGDYFGETRFYYELIDLFRAPEEIKRITGAFAARSWKLKSRSIVHSGGSYEGVSGASNPDFPRNRSTQEKLKGF